MTGFTDWHCHALWGMDDGAKSFSDSCQMLEMAAAEGIHCIALTPHAYPGAAEFDKKRYDRHLERLRQWVRETGLPLELQEGAEIHYTDALLPLLRENRLPTLGGSRYVLVEFSREVRWPELEKAVHTLFRGGYIPVVAHIERYRRLYGHKKDLLALREEADVCYQANAAALTGSRNLRQRLFLRGMLRHHAIDLIATDAHDCLNRPPRMEEAYKYLKKHYGSQYAQKRTTFTPEGHLAMLCRGEGRTP